MSIHVMNEVWSKSQHKGGALNLMLAIADFASDQGSAYPGVPTLAQKIRMSTRNTQLLLRKLEESGELKVEEGAGPRGTNRYQIQLQNLGKKPAKIAAVPGEKTAPPKRLQGEKTSQKGVKNLHGAEREGVNQLSPDPSCDPSWDPSSSAAANAAGAAGGDGGAVAGRADAATVAWLTSIGVKTRAALRDLGTLDLGYMRHQWAEFQTENAARARPLTIGAFVEQLRANPTPALRPPPPPPTDAAPAEDTRRPDWIAPGHWQGLTDPQRDALALSNLVDGRVEARYADLTETIYARWAPTIQRLIEETGAIHEPT
jgi:hypothetical protein